MESPNVVGYVTEFVGDRDASGDLKVRFKLKLKNTLGEYMVVWADLDGGSKSPEDVSRFYGSEK